MNIHIQGAQTPSRINSKQDKHKEIHKVPRYAAELVSSSKTVITDLVFPFCGLKCQLHPKAAAGGFHASYSCMVGAEEGGQSWGRGRRKGNSARMGKGGTVG